MHNVTLASLFTHGLHGAHSSVLTEVERHINTKAVRTPTVNLICSMMKLHAKSNLLQIDKFVQVQNIQLQQISYLKLQLKLLL